MATTTILTLITIHIIIGTIIIDTSETLTRQSETTLFLVWNLTQSIHFKSKLLAHMQSEVPTLRQLLFLHFHQVQLIVSLKKIGISSIA